MRIGLISDTHGLLRPEALAFLRGSDLIVHAGDICDRSLLDALRAIAPTTAVRGNNDRGDVLYVNPGSAGPRRFKLPISLAALSVDDSGVTARFVELEGPGRAGPRPLVPGR